MVIEVNKKIVDDEPSHAHTHDDRFMNACEALYRMMSAEKFDREQLDVLKMIIDGEIEFEK